MAFGEARMLLTQFVPHEARVLPLFGLQPIGVTRVFGEVSEIEFGDLASASVAILILSTDETLCLERLGHGEFIQHVERGRMESRGAQGFGQIRQTLEQRHWDACLCESQRCGTADGPGACDDDRRIDRQDFCPQRENSAPIFYANYQ